VNQIIILVGRLVNKTGQALGYYTINNAIGFGNTDAEGWFQIEVLSNTHSLDVSKNELNCHVTLAPNYPIESGLAVFDDLICQKI
jgi:hypothetical protein